MPIRAPVPSSAIAAHSSPNDLDSRFTRTFGFSTFTLHVVVCFFVFVILEYAGKVLDWNQQHLDMFPQHN